MLDHLPCHRVSLRGLRLGCRGNSAVEFAIAAPVVILLAFGAFDYGSAYVESLRLNGAARAGAQEALYDPLNWEDTARLEQAALEEYVGHGLTSGEIEALPVSAAATSFCACTAGAVLACSDSCPGGDAPGRFVRVTLNRGLALTLPYPWSDGSQISVQGNTVMRVR